MDQRTLVSSTELHRVLRSSAALPVLLQRLPPKAIGRLIGEIGLHDSAELMALTPRKKLLAVFDESIWKNLTGGLDESLDVSELVNWLEAWIDIGETFVAQCLAAMSDDYLTQCMAHLISVEEEGAPTDSRRDTGEHGDADRAYGAEDGQHDRFGPYLVRSAEADESDIVRVVLQALWSDAPDRLLRILATLIERGPLLTQHDVAFERQRHREQQGYVTASGARAFLAFGTTASLAELFTLAEYDNESRRRLAGGLGTAAWHSPVADDVVDEDEIATETATDPSPVTMGRPRELGSELDTRTAQELQALLQYLQPPPSSTLRLEHRDHHRPLPLLALLDELATSDYGAFEQRERELAYLANVAISALRSNAAELDPSDARSMVVATCNLGLELLHAKQLPVDLEREPGLLRLFLIGWRALNELPERVRQAFERAAAIPSPTAPQRRWLREQVKVGLDDLASSLAQRDFAAAREAGILLSIAFDRSSCLAIALLLDEIPRFPASLEGAAPPRGARWLESMDDLNRVAALLANLALKA